MRRLLLAWLLAIPLVAVGSQAAHWLAYDLAAGAATRGSLLDETGHGYLAVLPVLVAASIGLVAAIFLMVALDGSSGRTALRVQRWPFALVPFVGFVAQELAERGMAGHPVAFATLLEAPVLLGLALQLPFAILSYAIAVVLTGAASRLGRALAAAPARVARASIAQVWSALASAPARAMFSATTPARGPPAAPLSAVR